METINLLAGASYVSLIFGITFLSAALFSKGLTGPSTYWGSGLVLLAMGFALLGSQGILSVAISVMLENMLLIVAVCLLSAGVRRFLADPPANWICMGVMPCSLLASAFFTYGVERVDARVMVVSLVIAGLCADNSRRFALSARRNKEPVLFGFSGLFGLLSAGLLLRAVYQGVNRGTSNLLSKGQHGDFQFILILVSVLIVLIGLGLYTLIYRRHHRDFKSKLDSN